MQHRYLDDPFVRDQIDLALRPFVGVVADDEMRFMRGALAQLLEDDASAAELLDAARPRSVDESGECDKVGVTVNTVPAGGTKSA